jgi:hypothetical protein
MTNAPTVSEASGFDFSVPAELYVGRGSPRRHGLRFKQFDTAAEAIQYAMERPRAIGEVATMECDDKRFVSAEIASLYHDPAYPLPRVSVSATEAERPSIAVPLARTQRSDPPGLRSPAGPRADRGDAAAAPTFTQHRHRYKVGMRLLMTPGGVTVARQASYCKVTFVLPYEGAQLLYRVRSEIEAFERVVSESDLAPVKNGG